MAYLVTGGTGYIGSYVVRDLLQKGKKVVCLQRSGVTQVARDVVGEAGLAQVKVIQGDVSDPVQLFDIVKTDGVEQIIHIAYAIPPASETQPDIALRVNCGGMVNVLEAVRLFRLKKLVWTSSAGAFGRIAQFYHEPIKDDDAIYMPDSMYGATKVVDEFLVKLYFEKFGVDSIGFRLPRVYGFGRLHGSLGVFTQVLRKGALNIPVTVADADLPKGYLYVEDLSDAILTACDAPATRTRVFNLVEGEHTNREVAEIIGRLNPQARITLGEMSKEDEEKTRHVRNRRPAMPSDGVRAELGWQPKYGLEQAIRKILNYFRQQEGMPPL